MHLRPLGAVFQLLLQLSAQAIPLMFLERQLIDRYQLPPVQRQELEECCNGSGKLLFSNQFHHAARSRVHDTCDVCVYVYIYTPEETKT